MTNITYRAADGTDTIIDVAEGKSVMEGAVYNNLPGIDAECGGACACATCQVFVDEAWVDRVPAKTEEEESMLEFATGVRPTSRLSCQIKVEPSLEGLVVHVPASQR